MGSKKTEEDKYIAARKRKAGRLSFLFRIMWLVPIKKKKVVFACYEGDGGYGCNPKYIADEMIRRKWDGKIVWLTHDVTREFPAEIKVVKDTPWHTAFHLATAQIWIDNYRKPYGTLKRKGQLYIQTWHASFGFKAVGLYRGDKFPKIARIVSEWDSSLIDYIISNSEYCDKVYPKKLLYSGPTLRVGSPRVDPLINRTDEERRTIRKKLGINSADYVILYAPTFRGGTQKEKKKVETETFTIDLDLLAETTAKRFEKNCTILLRLHPQLAASQNLSVYERANIKDVSSLPDISEIMTCCDMVITDYSSCGFDAAFAGVPVVLYADDMKKYIDNRGDLMWKREELPFDIAETNEELMQLISDFDEKQYQARCRAFMSEHGVVEDGRASQHVVDAIETFI
ncbi:MAG: hypothetical protein E7297_04310 [Lachnospiraceae bacterium]|jgi:CDP-glycerol glycerophosphotransferase|nr:hypothetical protein [Lachnospiraceae bacterium]